MCFPHFPQEDAAVFRTQETLESGKQRIDEVVASFDDIGVRFFASPDLGFLWAPSNEPSAWLTAGSW